MKTICLSLLLITSLAHAECVQMTGKISGMNCGSCKKKIEAALKKIPNIDAVKIDLKSGSFTASAKAGTKIDEKMIQDTINKLDDGGFTLKIEKTN